VYAFDAPLASALGGSHRPCARVSFLAPSGAVAAAYEGGGSILTGGGVSFDRTRVGRRSGSVELANRDGALSPQDVEDLAFPGARLRLERGAVIGTGRSYGLLATLRIRSFDAAMTGRLGLACEDVLEVLAQPFGEVLTVSAGTPAADVLRTAWEPVLGDASAWNLDDAGRTVPARSFLEDEDRLASVAQLMGDLGLEVFSDRTGNVVLRPIPDPMAAPVARRFERIEGVATMLDLVRSGSRTPYNRVIVVAESPDRPTVRAIAEVTDTSSPIHRDRIGLRTAPIYRSAQIPDQAAANAVAVALLVQYSLFQDAIGGTSFPALELDEDDVVEYVEPISGANDRYRLDRITHPLVSGGTQQAATKVLPVFVTL
jgi:hypothetical protein